MNNIVLSTLSCPVTFYYKRNQDNDKSPLLVGYTREASHLTVKPGINYIDDAVLHALKTGAKGKKTAFQESLESCKNGVGIFLNNQERCDDYASEIDRLKKSNPLYQDELARAQALKKELSEKESLKKETAQLRKELDEMKGAHKSKSKS